MSKSQRSRSNAKSRDETTVRRRLVALCRCSRLNETSPHCRRELRTLSSAQPRETSSFFKSPSVQYCTTYSSVGILSSSALSAIQTSMSASKLLLPFDHAIHASIKTDAAAYRNGRRLCTKFCKCLWTAGPSSGNTLLDIRYFVSRGH